MKAIGIIAEFNPFTNGHEYLLHKAHEIGGEDAAVICVMSGDFVQRGEPAVINKFARAEAACRCGADLVVELPLRWSLSSAENFAAGGIRILEALTCDKLMFGCEDNDLNSLEKIAAVLSESEFYNRLSDYIKKNPEIPFALARENFLHEQGISEADLLSKPNNILAVEYLKAIKKQRSAMVSIPVKRIGAAHDAEGEGNYRSASEIRSFICNEEKFNDYVPAESRKIMERELVAGRGPISSNILEIAFLSRLRMLKREDFDKLPDGENGSGDRLFDAVKNSISLKDIIETAKTKRYAESRFRRMLCCAALGISGQKYALPPYIRILAANTTGRKWLRENKDKVSLPIIIRSSEVKCLDSFSGAIFEEGSTAHDLYVLGYRTEAVKKCGDDWRTGPFID